MPFYGPTAGVSSDTLFDTIVHNIDAEKSGNATGWNIVRDCRNASRPSVNSAGTPAPVGYQPITRKSSVYFPNNVSNLGANKYEIISNVHKNYLSNVQYAICNRYNGTANSSDRMGFRTSSDGGVTFGAFTSFVSVASHPFWTGLTYHDIVVGPADTAVGNYPSLLMKQGSTDWTALLAAAGGGLGYSTPISTAAAFTAPEALSTFQKPYAYCLNNANIASNYRLYYFFVTGTTNQNLRIVRLLNSYSALTLTGTITATALGVDSIVGVSHIIDRGSYHEMYISVVHSGAKKVIKCRTATGGLTAFDTAAGITVLSYVDQLGQDLEFADDYILTSVIPNYNFTEEPTTLIATSLDAASGSKSYSKSPTGSVDGNPDLQGLQYEYVVFESDHTSNLDKYYLVLLQLNPSQAAPPSVSGLTDVRPIFARVVRDWNVGTEEPTRLFFDPIIPSSFLAGTYNTVGPALITQPAGSPDSFTLRMKVVNRQIFISTASTGGTVQTLHANIATPTIPLQSLPANGGNNDNFIVSASGHAGGTGCIYLGRNGYSETDLQNVRNDGGRGYYGLGFEATYTGILTDYNSVDNKDYAFKIYGIDDKANANSTPVPSLKYIVGELFETRYFPRTTGVSNFSTVNVDGVDYLLVRSTVPGSPHVKNPAVVQSLLIKWE